MNGLLLSIRSILVTGIILLLFACGGGRKGDEKPDALLVLNIVPGSKTLFAGKIHQFKAAAIYTGAREEDVTGEVEWSSADEDLALIDKNGLLTAVAEGEVNIKASFGGLSKTAKVTVNAVPAGLSFQKKQSDSASQNMILVDVGEESIIQGESLQLYARLSLANEQVSDVTTLAKWSSSDQSVAKVSSYGEVEGFGFGEATISAEYEGVTQEIAVTVLAGVDKLNIVLAHEVMRAGDSVLLDARILYRDERVENVTVKAHWTVNNPTLAEIRDGRLYALAPGTVGLTALYAGKQTTLLLEITDQLKVVVDTAVHDWVRLNWNDVSADEYHIFWSTKGNVDTTGNNFLTTSDSFYHHEKLDRYRTYFYKVVALSKGEVLQTSDELQVFLRRDRWEQTHTRTLRLRNFGFHVSADKAWLVGGETGAQDASVVQSSRDAVSFDLQASRLETHSDFNTQGISGSALCGNSERLFTVGGVVNNRPVAAVSAYTIADNNSVLLTALPEVRAEHQCQWVNGKLYVFGGYDGFVSLDSVLVFDEQAKTWSQETALPQTRRGAASVTYGNLIVITGGLAQDGTALATVDAYNVVEKTWSVLPSLLTARGFHAIALNDDALYVSGGEAGTGVLAEVERLLLTDVVNNSWESIATLPQARSRFASYVFQDELHFVGGENETGFTDVTVALDLRDNSWFPRRQSSLMLADSASAVDGNSIYFFGGRLADDSPSAQVLKYDIVSNTWSELASMSTARYAASAVVKKGLFYVMGGEGVDGRLAGMELYDPEADQWSDGVSMPVARSFARAEVYGDDVYVMGGKGATKLMHHFDGVQWRADIDMPENSINGSSLVFDDRIVFVGGSNSYSTSRSVVSYLPGLKKWTAMDDMLLPREGAAAVLLNNRIYAIGGTGSALPSNVESYDTASGQWRMEKTLDANPGNLRAHVINGQIYVLGGVDAGGAPYRAIEVFK